MTRIGVDRVLKFAFELAQKRDKKHLTSCTKSNGISITMPYWDERVKEMAKRFPGVAWDQYHVDILTAHFVLHPDWFDVVVASNLFGDILSDLGPAGNGIANPIGQIWSGAMMLDHLGESEAAAAIVSAIEKVLAEPKLRTGDLKGSANTQTSGKAVAEALA